MFRSLCFFVVLSLFFACGDESAATTVDPDTPTDVSTYAPPAAPTDRAETEVEKLARNSLVDTDVAARVQRSLRNAAAHIQAAEGAVPNLNQTKVTVQNGCTVSFFNTRADGVAEEYRMNLNDFDYQSGLELRADNGVDVLYPGIVFNTRNREQTIQRFENGVSMGRTAAFPLTLDTRERVQDATGELITAIRICQDPDFR